MTDKPQTADPDFCVTFDSESMHTDALIIPGIVAGITVRGANRIVVDYERWPASHYWQTGHRVYVKGWK